MKRILGCFFIGLFFIIGCSKESIEKTNDSTVAENTFVFSETKSLYDNSGYFSEGLVKYIKSSNQQLYLDISLPEVLELGFSEKEYNDVLKGIDYQNIEIKRLISEGCYVYFPEEDINYDLSATKGIDDDENLWFGTATLRNSNPFFVSFSGTSTITAWNNSIHVVTISGSYSPGFCIMTSNSRTRLSSSTSSGQYYYYSLTLQATGIGLQDAPANVYFTQF